MEWMRGWLLAITCAAVIAALADALSPPGTPRKITRIAGGLLLLLAVLQPVKELSGAELSGYLEKYRAEYEGYAEAMAQTNEAAMKSIIEERTGAYIWDKATALGIRDCQVTVVCRVAEGGFPVPDTVTVRGAGSQTAFEQLSHAIAVDFAVDSGRQTLERTDGT